MIDNDFDDIEIVEGNGELFFFDELYLCREFIDLLEMNND